MGLGGLKCDDFYTIANMPEFLAEGSAINDLVNPQRVVIGTQDENAFNLLKKLTLGTSEESESQELPPVIRATDTGSSELGKLMCNAMLA